MATPSSDDIAKLVGEIRHLKDSLDQLSIDREQIEDRSNAALAGLLTGTGEFNTTAWNNLTDEDRAIRAAKLASLKQNLLNAIAAEPTVSIAPDSFMYKTAASNGWIVLLTIFAFFGLFADLGVVYNNWTEATSGLPEPSSSPTPS